MSSRSRPEPRKRPQQQRSQFLFDTMLDAAALVLEEQGPDLKLTLVVERAGVSPGSFYQYFPDRDALLGALIDRQVARDRRLLEQLRANPEPIPVEQLPHWLVDGVLRLYGTRPQLMVRLFEAHVLLGRMDDLRRITQEFCDALAERLRHGASEQASPPTLESLVSAMAAVLAIVRQTAAQEPARLSEADFRERLIRVVRAALLLD